MVDKGQIYDILAGLLGPTGTAAVGILMRRIDELRRGSPWSWRRLLFDVPSVFGLGVVAAGLAELLGASTLVASGIAAVAAYLGHEWLFQVIRGLAERRYRS